MPPGSLDDLLALTPAADSFRDYVDAVWSDAATDRGLLELCRRRMAFLLGRGEWDADVLDARRRTAVAFAEQWLVDPSSMTDEMCAALRSELGDAAAVSFTFGLAIVEAQLRFEAVMT